MLLKRKNFSVMQKIICRVQIIGKLNRIIEQNCEDEMCETYAFFYRTYVYKDNVDN